ncbi:MAG: gluconate 2-dehydrogenase subunit 3 family protein [Siphonobacter sp.]
MKRREALQWVGVMMGGMLATPALADIVEGRKALPTNAAALPIFDQPTEALLAEIADVIIPTTPDSPGAKAAGVAPFINTLVTDCYPKEYQTRLLSGLARVDRETKAVYGKSFAEASNDQKTSILKLEEANAYADRKAGSKEQSFWFIVKELTLFGYFTSEIGATQALSYEYVPSRYEGCIPLKPGQKAWAT